MSVIMLCSCHNSYEALNSCPEKLARRSAPQLPADINFKKQIKSGMTYSCDIHEFGFCISPISDLSSDFFENLANLYSDNNSLILSIPKFTLSNDYNPLYTQISDSDSFQIPDTVTIINPDILEFLNIDYPVTIEPGSFPATFDDNDNIFISLPMIPAHLSNDVVVYLDNGSLIFDTYYHGFLGESSFPTAIIEYINDNFMALRFPFDINENMNEQFLSEIANSSALTIETNSEIYDNLILEILNIDSPIVIENGTYFASENENGIIVILPFQPIP